MNERYPSFEKDVLPTRRQHPDSILTFNHSGSAVTCQDDHLIEVYHCDRSSQQADESLKREVIDETSRRCQ